MTHSQQDKAQQDKAQQNDAQLTPLKRAFLALEEMQNKLAAVQAAAREPIAVIGVGCRFPGGADTPDAYWQFLRSGREAVSEPPAGRAAAVDGVGGPNCAAWLQEPVDAFDPQFFSIAPREAHGMDPQQRLLLEVAWEALENACQAPDRLEGTRTGVFMGVAASDYLHLYLKGADEALFDGYYASGIAHSIASGRLSYLLGLQGPSVSLDTACSSSLSAVHLAVGSLRSGESDMALAGGVNLMLSPENFLAFDRFGMLAADGRCKTFDAAADGFGRGEGCGVVVLKRLSDAQAHGDPILAVIRGSAMNQDGASSGLTAPNGPAQEAVLRAALDQAGIDPALVSYIETHGTGTSLGDPIEVQALGSVFGPSHSPDRPLRLGAVKASLGHTEAAAGVAGLIKLALALHHGEIPPQANFHTPSPFIPWARLPLVVPTEVTPWTPIEGRRIGGVSAFGFSGTNVHVVVEAAPEPAVPVMDASADRPLHLLALSAKHPAALTELAARYAAQVETNEALQLADVCYSANTGRAQFGRRLTVAAASSEELAQKLRAFAEGQEAQGVGTADAEGAKPKIAFLFTGQGSQYAGMGRELYRTQPTFRAALDRCAAILQDHLDTPLLEIIDPPPGAPNRLDDTTYTQPALFAIEWALAQLWQSWGVTPNFVMGHSVGEYVAAALAGVFSLEDALKLIAARGRLMGALPSGGAMAAVFAPEEAVAAAVEPYRATVSIAAVNGPDNTVISGRGEDVAAILQALKAEGVKARALKVSHAFHSPLLDPMLPEFAEAARTVTYHAPRVRLVSNVTGELAPGALTANAEYWRGHSRAPVRFAAAIDTLRKQGVDVFLEIGPGSTLIGMGERCLADVEQDAEPAPLWAASLKPPRSDWAALLDSAAALYRAGVPIDWESFDRPYTRRRIALPTYPFQRGRYWLPQREGAGQAGTPALQGRLPAHRLTGSPGHPLLGRRLRSALAAAQYEIELGEGVLPYLDDHRVQGTAILPGAAFMEAALAAGKPAAGKDGAALAVEDMLLLEALTVPDGETRSVQWIVTPGEQGEWAFACYSQGGQAGQAGTPALQEEWRLHAQARLVPAAADAPAAVDLAALQAGLPDVVTAEEHYAQLAANGLDFGPSLLGVQQIRRKSGEALGRIAPTAAVAAEAAGYALHPALLDAHLQVIASAMPAGEGVYLPFSLERLRLLRAGVTPVWSHVVLQSGAGDATLAADLQLLGEGGEVVAVLEGLRLKRLDKSLAAPQSMAPFAKWLYEVAWEPRPLEAPPGEMDTRSPAHPLTSAWPPLDEAAAELARRLEELEEQHNLAAYALDVAPQLDSLSLLYIAGALAELGWRPRAGERFKPAELEKTLGIAPRHSRLLRRLCEILAEEGVVEAATEANGEAWQVIKPLPAGDPTNLERSLRQKHTAYTAEIELTARCGRQLAAALSGRIDPVHLLFPGGDLSTTEALYRESPSARVYNGLMRATVELLATRRAANIDGSGAAAPLRVLEIGGGTGGTTAYLLPMLPADRTEYLFTDISPLFAARAEEKFGSRHPFAAFAVLDLEKEPAQQGLGDRQFDLIVAANVIHATADLRQSLGHIRRLLAPDGVLVMLEVTGPQRWVDVTFGLTDGWWRFVDRDLRQGYPLIPIAQWKELLGSCGFDAAVTAPAEDGAGFIDQAVIVAHKGVEGQAGTPAVRERWLLLADRGGVGERLGRQLAQRGAGVTLASAASSAGSDFAQAGDGSFTLDPMQPEHFRRLLAALGDEPPAGVVYLWSLDAPAGEVDAQTLTQAAAEANAGALHLVQALAAQEGQTAPRLWFVTRSAQSAPAGGDLPAVVQSPLWGLAQAVTLEHPELQLMVTDLDGANSQGGDAADADVRGLLAELLAPDGEDRSAWRGGERFAARLVQSRRTEQARGDRPVALEIGQRGTLQQLALRPLTRRAPGRGEVEIRVRAAALNFKDVLNTLGMYPGDAGALGGECAGEVAALGEGVTGLEVGQRVLAIAPGAFRSYVAAQAPLVAPLPEGMSYAEGASIPIAFVTAAYTLRHLGKLQAGERVLIHAAAGGVGLAAVQIAQMLGAEVLATAGSESKRAYLRSLGVRHVFDSRSLSFADGVREATGGRGVDVALNSLAGEFIPATLALLAPGGRFLEIGKSGLLTPEQAAGLGEGRQYFIVDWTPDALQQPALIRGLLDRILGELAAGKLRPLPQRSFALADAEAAFRFMAQARHIGKIVLRMPAGAGEEVGLSPDGRRAVAIRPDASYLITGGLRGLGLLVGGWLAEQGAGGVLLVGRSAPDDEARAAIERMEAHGCRVLAVQADIAQRAEVERVLGAAAEKLPPLAGVVHAAGVLDDGALLQQSWARFAAVMAPKVQGAWHLHQLTEHLPLDFFVLFSSLASLFGSPGQGNHSAANAFLDALAHYRRGQGLPGTSINWGIWSEVGIAAQLAVGLQRSEQGLGTISPQNGLRLLAWILEQGPAQIGVTPITWPVYLAKFAGGRRPFFADVAGAWASASAAGPVQAGQAGTPAVQGGQAGTPAVRAKNLLDEVGALAPARRKPRLVEFVKAQTGQVLGLDPQAISERTPLSELGLDSLMAVELRNVLSQRMGLKRSLPATLVFDYPTIQAIADYLLRDLPVGDAGTTGAQASPPAAPPPVQPAAPGAGVLDDLETLSDEEVERRLAGQFSG